MDPRIHRRRCARQPAVRRGRISRRRGPVRELQRNRYSGRTGRTSRMRPAVTRPLGRSARLECARAAGSRTHDGQADPARQSPSRWASLYWEAHVTVPGMIDFYGSTLVGIPVLRAGFNGGWVRSDEQRARPGRCVRAASRSRRPDHYISRGAEAADQTDVTVEIRRDDGTSSGDADVLVFAPRADRLSTPRSCVCRAVGAARGVSILRGVLRAAKARTLSEFLAGSG